MINEMHTRALQIFLVIYAHTRYVSIFHSRKYLLLIHFLFLICLKIYLTESEEKFLVIYLFSTEKLFL
jgi:hypothetical protein